MKGQSRGPPIFAMVMWRRHGVLRGRPNDDPRAALPLGWTYDPAELTLGIPNFQAQGDPPKRGSAIAGQLTWVLPLRHYGWERLP
jgi:hypothetical protein